jgi:hypothetical protein
MTSKGTYMNTKLFLTMIAAALSFAIAQPVLAQKGGGGGQTGDSYGALAYNEETGAYGYAYDYDTQAEASKAAVEECGKDCKVVMQLKNECGAIAQSQKFYGWANGASRKAAEKGALDNCGKDCKVVAWTCTVK